MKVFQIYDELYAAETAEQAAVIFSEMSGDQCDEEPRELSDDELDAPQPEFDEDERLTGEFTSVRQMLEEFGNEPGWLAGPA